MDDDAPRYNFISLRCLRCSTGRVEHLVQAHCPRCQRIIAGRLKAWARGDPKWERYDQNAVDARRRALSNKALDAELRKQAG